MPWGTQATHIPRSAGCRRVCAGQRVLNAGENSQVTRAQRRVWHPRVTDPFYSSTDLRATQNTPTEARVYQW